MKTLFLLLGAFASFASAQVRYSATTGDVVLSAAGTKFTIQQPATGPASKQVTLETAVVYCSVACDVTQAQNGTAATATAGTANPVLPCVPCIAAAATVWTASNVGAGTAAGGILHVPAATSVVLDLSKVSMGNSGTKTNYTVVIAAITGTANITYFWSEK